MMRGFTASGKTTIAKKLACFLENTDIYHSAILREELGLSPEKINFDFDLEDPVFVQVISPIVYSEMALRAIRSLDRQKNVILDATYNFPWQRNTIYVIANYFRVNVYILQCTCRNQKEVMRRLGIREENEKNPFNEAPAWKTYLSTVKYSVTAENDTFCDGRKPKIIEYDTHTNKIRTVNVNRSDDIANKIIQFLKT